MYIKCFFRMILLYAPQDEDDDSNDSKGESDPGGASGSTGGTKRHASEMLDEQSDGLSAREINRLKRKTKLESKSKVIYSQ